MRFLLTTRTLVEVPADAIVVLGSRDGEPSQLPSSIRDHVSAGAGRFVSREPEALNWLETRDCKAPRVLLLFCDEMSESHGFNGGPNAKERRLHRRHELRVIGATIERACKTAGVQKVVLAALPNEEVVWLAEGMLLRSHSPRAFEPDDDPDAMVVTMQLHARAAARVRRTWRVVEAAARATNHARTLADLPSNLGRPEDVVRRVRTLARKVGLAVRVVSRENTAALGMGLFQGVDRGAAHPGCILVLEHRRDEASSLPTLALVGKGLCHDTGGYNLKTVPELHQLTYDKSGAAAVLGAMLAIAELDVPLHVIAACPLSENVVDANAFKPGDVLTAYDGTTVYIENTDAEGRLVLADVLAWLDDEIDPDLMIDVATLTGSAHVALGEPFAALFSNDDDARELVLAAAGESGDLVWPMPIHEVHEREIGHHKADIKNLGVRGGGSCSAAAFLRHFVSVRWAHIDIAGKSHTESARDYFGIGATGFGCRLLVDLARRFADEWELQ